MLFINFRLLPHTNVSVWRRKIIAFRADVIFHNTSSDFCRLSTVPIYLFYLTVLYLFVNAILLQFHTLHNTSSYTWQFPTIPLDLCSGFLDLQRKWKKNNFSFATTWCTDECQRTLVPKVSWWVKRCLKSIQANVSGCTFVTLCPINTWRAYISFEYVHSLSVIGQTWRN